MLVDERYSLNTFANTHPIQVHKLGLKEEVVFFQLGYLN